MSQNVLIIGICGVTCGGKTTVANKLNKILPSSKIISQDDYFLDVQDPRHVWIENLNHINFDIISSLDMDKMHQDLEELLKDKKILTLDRNEQVKLKLTFNQDLYKTVHNKLLDSHTEVIIVEGFSIFNYPPIQKFFSLKYYFLLDEKECLNRRKDRVYDPPDCPGYFEQCAWPEHLAQLAEVRKNFKDIVYFDEYTQHPCEEILRDILYYL